MLSAWPARRLSKPAVRAGRLRLAQGWVSERTSATFVDRLQAPADLVDRLAPLRRPEIECGLSIRAIAGLSSPTAK